MDDKLLKCFQFEVARQCRWAIMAVEELEETLSGLKSEKLSNQYGMNRLWMSVQNLLVAAGNISIWLWPSKPKIPGRGPNLRASLGVKDTSILKSRTFRNHFEHFDERLETFFLSLAPEQFLYVDTNVSPGGIDTFISGIDQRKVLRHLDSKSMRLIYRGESYKLEPLYREIIKLCQKAEDASRKH